MIELENITSSYGTSTAIRDISFQLKEGETLGLLGPNGAGKTTLIHLLLGIRSPDQGRIHTPWSTDPGDEQHRSHFGVVPQDPCLYDHLTGRENIMFFGQMYDLSGSELREQVNEALSRVDLLDRASDPVASYSNGMKRRLSFAGALTHQPGVLLLDEPLAGVDLHSQNPIFDCLESLQNQNRTILYLTHHLKQAQKLCNRAGILDQGQLIVLDDVDQLIEQYGGQTMVEITLVRPPDQTDELPGTLNGNTLRIRTNDPGEVISKLDKMGIEFQEYHVKPPDLTSVFMNLTGSEPRDDQDH